MVARRQRSQCAAFGDEARGSPTAPSRGADLAQRGPFRLAHARGGNRSRPDRALAMTYQPALWHDYFVMVGGGSAALTGLVFVAMTLHLQEIVGDPVQRHRSRTILAGLTAVFIRCALVLMGGQNAQAVAVGLVWVLLVGVVILFMCLPPVARSAVPVVLWRAVWRLPLLV